MMKRFPLGAVFVVVLLLLNYGCVPAPSIAPDPSNPVYTVALLPIYNATNDVDAPARLREAFAKRLEGRHYRVLPLDETDRILRDRMGITLGAQLDMTTPRKLGEELGVDGVVYGYLLNFDDVTTGVYNVKKVRAGFRLVHARSGRTLWARGHGVKSILTSGGLIGDGVAVAAEVKDAREGMEPFRSIEGISEIPGLTEWDVRYHREESVRDAAIMSLGEKLITKAAGMHLAAETSRMLDFVFADFPAGRGGAAYVASAEPPEEPALEPPAIDMDLEAVPEPDVAPLYFLEERDFSAVITSTAVRKRGGGTTKTTMKVAKRGGRLRVDLLEATGGEMPPIGGMSFIFDVDGRRSYSILHDRRMYIEDVMEAEDEVAPAEDKEFLGEESVAGRRCRKYRVTVRYSDGRVETGTVWEAVDLDGFIVRTEFENDDARIVTEAGEVKLGSPDEDLFVVPAGYEKVSLGRMWEEREDEGGGERREREVRERDER